MGRIRVVKGKDEGSEMGSLRVLNGTINTHVPLRIKTGQIGQTGRTDGRTKIEYSMGHPSELFRVKKFIKRYILQSHENTY